VRNLRHGDRVILGSPWTNKPLEVVSVDTADLPNEYGITLKTIEDGFESIGIVWPGDDLVELG
jgi:hypothetical protein